MFDEFLNVVCDIYRSFEVVAEIQIRNMCVCVCGHV